MDKREIAYISERARILAKMDVSAFLKMIRDKADEWRAKLHG